ncbi:methylmalonyl Co-A mutase-associated GTPase MeaB [Halostella sp. PRR32]|uniref:methylmalonyl Co-A mutase-associated GTPase MeaB n=1 Tax=Halostella sp. PRR32 TaxID=3098147 RepID=UPI002B1D4597|nr:methylmalonyl Co-A mutase-associated GTPase MeaB [Halostella sp. PRR32]
MTVDDETLVDELLGGKQRALARTITTIENREPGYRDLVSALYEHTGNAEVIGITGSPGAGKSTLVDKLTNTYRDRGETVGVIAVDPSSPYTGGAVLGDRIRMASNVGDMEVFFRSMSARGNLGGISTATADAVKALDAFGKDKIIVETVGAGQNEIDIVRTADTVAVLVPPDSGDEVQTLKAGILEIGDVFVVNKSDLPGADRTVQELKEMIQLRGDTGVSGGHHGPDHHALGDADAAGGTDAGTASAVSDAAAADGEAGNWTPSIVETVATDGTGIDELIDTFASHREYMEASGRLDEKARTRTAEEIRLLLREDASGLLERELDRHGGIEALVEAVHAGDTDPYAIADEVVDPIEECLSDRQDDPA